MSIKLNCDMCGAELHKAPCKVRKHNFCSRKCLSDFSSKTKNPTAYMDLKDYSKSVVFLKEHNAEFNKTRMTPGVREKLRTAHLGSGKGLTYTKYYGRHEHRVVAEQILGRPLKKGEVVHHINGDKRDNRPENLMVFRNQSEHLAHHSRISKGE